MINSFKKSSTIILIILLSSLLVACNNLQTRLDNVESILAINNFQKKIIETEKFNLVSYQRLIHSSDIATIYIEGDGLAWKNKYKISNNPTPENPVALKLATIDTSSVVIYVARPCQFVNTDIEKNCNPQYWTNKRASAEVIKSISSAINKVKKEISVNKLRLVGFSGGATIAAILAANRTDIIDLRTIAGNLDINKFVVEHHVTPLTGSLNPIDYADKLINVPQTHFVSSNDTIISRAITNSYIQRLKAFDGSLKCVNVIELSEPEHNKGWESYWPAQDFSNTQSCDNQF